MYETTNFSYQVLTPPTLGVSLEWMKRALERTPHPLNLPELLLSPLKAYQTVF
jgi:hypothetical protein